MPGESKTEKATPKKRRDERKKGHIFLSKDAVTAATLLGSIYALRVLFLGMVDGVREIFYLCLGFAGAEATEQEAGQGLLLPLLDTLAKAVGPLLLVTVLVAVGATFAQTKMLVSAQLLKPKFERINPLQGIKRLFSLRSVVEALKGVLKISVLLYLVYSCLREMSGLCANYLYMELGAVCGHLFEAIFRMMCQIALAFLVLAAMDFLYQWWEYERQLKMSKQEIKEEYKQTEGNPQLKGKIKELQRKMAQARMMQQVPQADIVIRNPTHYAVALRYRIQEDRAPVVLAKGCDELALRIVGIAREHHILTIENPPLARSLYAQAELNREIPPELYGAVAEVLVYLYQLDAQKQ